MSPTKEARFDFYNRVDLQAWNQTYWVIPIPTEHMKHSQKLRQEKHFHHSMYWQLTQKIQGADNRNAMDNANSKGIGG